MRYVVMALLSCSMLWACDLLVDRRNMNTKVWTISGDATVLGSPTVNIKMAAFYTGDNLMFAIQGGSSSNSYIMVSNVTSLGLHGGSFDCTINTENLNPRRGDYIEIIMWKDSNSNDTFEISEVFRDTEPFNNCPVFETADYCWFYYDTDANDYIGSEPGWNQDHGGANLVPISKTNKIGAIIRSVGSF